MITEYTEIGQVEIVLPGGNIQIRKDTVIERGGKEIHREHHRMVLHPGDSLEGQPDDIKAIAAIFWTEARIARYQELLKAAL